MTDFEKNMSAIENTTGVWHLRMYGAYLNLSSGTFGLAHLEIRNQKLGASQ
jgi:hypothetical protein